MLCKDISPAYETNQQNAIEITSRTAELIEDARLAGCEEMADRLENCFTDLLNILPKSDRATVLMKAFDSVMRAVPAPEPVQLRVVGRPR